MYYYYYVKIVTVNIKYKYSDNIGIDQLMFSITEVRGFHNSCLSVEIVISFLKLCIIMLCHVTLLLYISCIHIYTYTNTYGVPASSQTPQILPGVTRGKISAETTERKWKRKAFKVRNRLKV